MEFLRYLQRHTPKDDHSFLKFGAYLNQFNSNAHYRFDLDGMRYGCIELKYIPELIDLLHSAEKCLPVVMSASSYWPTAPSTVGHEAAYLIEGFRRGGYPSQLNSTGWPGTDQERRRFDEWVYSFRKQYNSRKHHP